MRGINIHSRKALLIVGLVATLAVALGAVMYFKCDHKDVTQYGIRREAPLTEEAIDREFGVMEAEIDAALDQMDAELEASYDESIR